MDFPDPSNPSTAISFPEYLRGGATTLENLGKENGDGNDKSGLRAPCRHISDSPGTAYADTQMSQGSGDSSSREFVATTSGARELACK